MFTLAFYSQTKSGYELLAEFEMECDKNINTVYGITLKFYINVYFFREEKRR